jgi:hypothetical protein
MPPSQHLPFAVLRGSRRAESLLWAGHKPTPIYIFGALRFWTDVPAHFTALKLPLLSTMLNSAITIVEAALRQSSYQDKSVVFWVSFARAGNPNHADLPHWPNTRRTPSNAAVRQKVRSPQGSREPGTKADRGIAVTVAVSKANLTGHHKAVNLPVSLPKDGTYPNRCSGSGR